MRVPQRKNNTGPEAVTIRILVAQRPRRPADRRKQLQTRFASGPLPSRLAATGSVAR